LRSGRILLGGTYEHRFMVARLRPDGRLDRSFGHRGVVVLHDLDGITAVKVVVQPDGKIVTVGALGFKLAAMRFMPGGELDPNFFDNGVLEGTGFGGPASDVLIDPEGRIVVAGGRGGTAFVLRILPDAGSS
jgi:uncharacterized delta-60 repeat protein